MLSIYYIVNPIKNCIPPESVKLELAHFFTGQ